MKIGRTQKGFAFDINVHHVCGHKQMAHIEGNERFTCTTTGVIDNAQAMACRLSEGLCDACKNLQEGEKSA